MFNTSKSDKVLHLLNRCNIIELDSLAYIDSFFKLLENLTL